MLVSCHSPHAHLCNHNRQGNHWHIGTGTKMYMYMMIQLTNTKISMGPRTDPWGIAVLMSHFTWNIIKDRHNLFATREVRLNESTFIACNDINTNILNRMQQWSIKLKHFLMSSQQTPGRISHQSWYQLSCANMFASCDIFDWQIGQWKWNY